MRKYFPFFLTLCASPIHRGRCQFKIISVSVDILFSSFMSCDERGTRVPIRSQTSDFRTFFFVPRSCRKRRKETFSLFHQQGKKIRFLTPLVYHFLLAIYFNGCGVVAISSRVFSGADSQPHFLGNIWHLFEQI